MSSQWPPGSGGGGGSLLAHGVGGRQDLPVSFPLVLVGAVVALVVSFGALAWLWRKPRLRGGAAGRPLPLAVQRFLDSPGFRWVLRGVGLLLTGFVAVAALWGPDRATNPAATWVFVLFWVGLVPASLVFGPVWRLLNPIRTIHRGIARVFHISPEWGPFSYPRWLGYWPAAVSLFSFTYLELVVPDRASTGVLVLYFLLYFQAQLTGAILFGSGWFGRGDGFEVYSSLVGRMSPLGRRDDGRLVLRNPLNGLDAIKPAAGLVATVSVLLGSTAYDGFSFTRIWVQTITTSSIPPETLGALGLVGFITVVYATYSMATSLAGTLGGISERGLPGKFVHSIIPIAAGYVIAHYFSFFVFEGQHALILASDPFDNGQNILGTANWKINYTLLSVGTIAVVQVVAIVAGHIIAVIAAHDRAVRLFPPRQAVADQIPLLLLMIGYTL
ncbi:MAG TPA: hypothetical protein VFO16_14735, partial [Pseudonocardiaceae bacterium]|nr:hypothetical protein [Pseudonocardiaceae bacterium]